MWFHKKENIVFIIFKQFLITRMNLLAVAGTLKGPIFDGKIDSSK